MDQRPFIHLFQTPIGYYMFDVNTDSIVKLPRETYHKLQNYSGNLEDEYISKLKKIGLLRPNKERISRHPESDYISYQIQSNLRSLLLQVTQNCNQRCDYCVYSGKYYNRTHNAKRMNFETAKKGIDLIIKSSKDSDTLQFGFYGGEPLLEKELIKKCIKYVDDSVEGKKVNYNITTNGTLITKDILEVFVAHNVSVTISLDGPEEIHNKNRGFATGGGNPHAIIMDTLRNIKEKYPEYYARYISFNTVLDGKNSFKSIEAFFVDNDLFEDKIITLSIVADKYAKNKNKYDEQFVEELKYARFLSLLVLINRLDKKDEPKLLERQKDMARILRDKKQFGDKKELPICGHRSGPCTPGVHRLFMTVDGDFYPCERVSECSDICKIGSLEKGFDFEKIERLLNLEWVTEEECKKCWAYEYCTICLAHVDDTTKISKELILNECQRVRYEIENIFKDYCVYKELRNK